MLAFLAENNPEKQASFFCFKLKTLSYKAQIA
jgi:hypothetical protein